MALPHVFATQPAGNVPASYLDDNFDAITGGGTPLSGSTVLATGSTTERTLADRFQKPFNAMDFGVVADGVTDDTVAIQAALTAVGALGGGVVELPQGIILYSTVLTLPKAVFLRGQGPVNPSHNGTAPTRLKWVGGAGPTIKCGRQGVGELWFSGGISNIMFENFAGTATYFLDIRDIQNFVIDSISTRFSLTAEILISNTTNGGSQEPTQAIVIRNSWLGAAGTSHGIKVDGLTAGGAEGVTNCKLENCIIFHDVGDGINLGLSNDGFKYDNVFFFGSGAGYSVHWASASASQSSGFHYFFGCFFRTGLFAVHAIGGLGSQIFGNGDSSDGVVTPTQMVLGPGAFGVAQFPSFNGKLFGTARVHGYLDAIHTDSMAYVKYVSANTVLHTCDGNWLTSVDAAGDITDAAVAGGATLLTTGNANARVTTIQDTAFGSGPTINAFPQMAFAMFMVGTLTNQKVRAGWLNDVGDAPVNGIYLEANVDNSAFFQAVTASAGTRTSTSTAITIDTTISQWRIECTGTSVMFWNRPGSSNLWSLVATNTTNIPTSAFPLSCTFTCKTGTAAFKQVAIADFRRAFNVEV